MSLFFTRGRQTRDVVADLIPSRVAAASSFAEPVTQETAPQVVAYGSAVNLLASLTSMLPVKVYNGDGQEARSVPAVLDDPQGEGYGFTDWVKQFTESAATTGNTVSIVRSRDGKGTPSVLDIVPISSVVVGRDANGFRSWTVNGQPVARRDVCHFRRYPKAGRILGESPIGQFASTLGLALSAERFGGQWFTDGAHPSAVLESDHAISLEQANTIKKRVTAALRGKREPVALGRGLKYKTIQVNPEESQFLETQKFTSAQCARILGPGLAEVLGYPSGDSMTYSSREQGAIDLVIYSLDPWLVGIEQALSRWLGGGRSIKFNRGALLRADLKTRYEAHRLGLGPVEPFVTANEVRDLEDMKPTAWGNDRPAVQGDKEPV